MTNIILYGLLEEHLLAVFLMIFAYINNIIYKGYITEWKTIGYELINAIIGCLKISEACILNKIKEKR